jgi:ribosomal protein S27E
MEKRCHGQEDRNLQLVEQVCPNCAAEVEFFGSEAKVKCYKCGQLVLRDQ